VKRLTQRGLQRIDEFVDDWEPLNSGGGRAIDRQALRAALIDFHVAENAHATPASRAADEALALLKDAASPAADDLRDVIIDLRDRLERADELNLILREHHVMLAETNRRLRQSHSAPNQTQE
jgi:hypothetical protein